MSEVNRHQLNTSKCYATTGGEYLGKYKHTKQFNEGQLGSLTGLTTVCVFDEGDVHDADTKTFKEVDCITQPYAKDENGNYKCQYCNAVQRGKYWHYFGCKNPQKNPNKQGGRKNRKPTKKNRRRNRRSSKKNRRN